jgi:hypothetical protein
MHMKTGTYSPLTIEEVSPELPNHLAALPGTEFSVWRCAGLRGAGFPAQEILRLAAPQALIHAVDEILRMERDSETLRQRALEQVNCALDRLRASGEWEDKSKRAPMVNALQKLKAGGLPKCPPDIGELSCVDELHRAAVQKEKTWESLREEFARSSLQNSRLLQEIAAWPRFREAVIWQNRRAVRNALDSLRRTPLDGAPLNSRSRQNEELVAGYLQRYCVKNDTIGFFGPVGWASFIPSGKPLTARPGQDFLAARTVYFETWPIEALANAIARDRNIYPWLAPIRMPFIRMEGSTLHHPIYGPMRIPPYQAAILRACEGSYTAKQIAGTLLRSNTIQSEQQFYKTLSDLAARGLVFWGFNIPFEAHPENALRKALQRIEDASLRRRALEMLDELDSAREVVATAAGDPEQLDRALDNIEQTFTRLTSVSATRDEGKVYAGRTIIYEDCRRNIDVQLGPELLQALALPLSLLLISARWLTWEIATICRKNFREIHQKLVQATGSPAVEAAVFFQEVAPFLLTDRQSLSRPAKEEFQKKWERILHIDNIGPKAGPVQFCGKDLKHEVLAEFHAPRSGCRLSCYHSPDIMIVAPSVEAVQRGDYLLALGEMHVAGNTLSYGLFVNQHPFPEDLVHAMEEDLSGPSVVPLPQRNAPELLGRLAVALMSANDFRLEYVKDGLAADRARALPIASLVIEEHHGELIARTRDRRLSFELLDLAGGLIHSMIVDSFRMVGSSRHMPRISIDRFVIKRESWQFSPAELTFAREADPLQRFVSVRRWAQLHGLPRFVFFKVTVERKPAYLDLESLTLVDIFCKMVRRTQDANLPESAVDVTEMLPVPDQVWLPDSDGNRYTSEFRIVAVDMKR